MRCPNQNPQRWIHKKVYETPTLPIHPFLRHHCVFIFLPSRHVYYLDLIYIIYLGLKDLCPYLIRWWLFQPSPIIARATIISCQYRLVRMLKGIPHAKRHLSIFLTTTSLLLVRILNCCLARFGINKLIQRSKWSSLSVDCMSTLQFLTYLISRVSHSSNFTRKRLFRS